MPSATAKPKTASNETRSVIRAMLVGCSGSFEFLWYLLRYEEMVGLHSMAQQPHNIDAVSQILDTLSSVRKVTRRSNMDYT